MFDKDNKFGFISNNNESNNNIEGLDKVKTDLNNIKSDLGDKELTTTNKDIKGAINEVNAQYKDIANLFTAEQTTNSYKIKCGNKIIAEIPINTSSSEKNFGSLLSSITTWNVMGNSITDENINPTTKYPTILKNKYTNITTVNNYAHNGWHVAVKSGTGYNSFLTLIDSMSSSCDLITIAGGVNDFIQGVPIGERSSTLDTEFYGAVNNLITRLRAKYSDATIIWIIPIPMRNGVFGTNSNGTNTLGNTLEDYRKALRNKLNDLQVKCIDLSTDADMDYNKISADGLHPTANGHQIYANKLDNSTPFIPLGEQSIGCTNITLNQSALTFTTTDTQTLIATKTPSNTTDTVVWSVSPTGICTVENGTVTPIKDGNCVVTVTCGTKTATCNVTVTGVKEDKPCINIVLNNDTLTFTNTTPQTLTATLTPTDTTDKVIWSVNPTGIVSVNAGVVTPIKNGECTITATCGTKTATCGVEVSSLPVDNSKKIIMNNYNNGVFNLTALVTNPKTQLSTVKLRIKSSQLENCKTSSGSTIAVAVFGDNTGELNNSAFIKQQGGGSATIDSSGYLECVWQPNTIWDTEYLKVPVGIYPTDKNKECSLVIDDLQVLINDVKVPILKLGGFFKNHETLTGDINYILNYVNNL